MSSTPTAAPRAAIYSIEPAHTAAHFKVRHMMIANVRGEFCKVSGKVTIDASNPSASSVSAEIDVNSINTREPDRDKHLKSSDFFDAANYPTITFQSKKIEPDGPEGFQVTGDLTIRGVTREVVLYVTGPTPEVKDPWGYTRRGVEAVTKINRKEFGVAYNQALEAGGVLVGEEVEISIEAELVKAA
ncbi:MAG TPA: YceI family protein [Bryobacteraceae bacterium]|nr:YceI family protein [Bryobacteraceae bacterium]